MFSYIFTRNIDTTTSSRHSFIAITILHQQYYFQEVQPISFKLMQKLLLLTQYIRASEMFEKKNFSYGLLIDRQKSPILLVSGCTSNTIVTFFIFHQFYSIFCYC